MGWSLSSSGIVAPASASLSGTANTLDDYEEGTFAQNQRGSGGNKDYNVSGSGYYCKIGKLVNQAGLHDAASAANNAVNNEGRQTSLPFAVTTAQSSCRYGGAPQYVLTSPANFMSMVWRTYDGLGAWAFLFYKNTTNTHLQDAIIANNDMMHVHGSFTYQTDV